MLLTCILDIIMTGNFHINGFRQMNYKAEYLGFKNINDPMKSVCNKAEYSELKKLFYKISA